MKAIAIWVTLPDGNTIRAAELVTEEPSPGNQEVKAGEFRYTDNWLVSPQAFPLDPAHLPLQPDSTRIPRHPGFPAVLADALPGRWGRKLLAEEYKLHRGHILSPGPDLLLAAGGRTLGALSFTAFHEGRPPTHPVLGERNLTALEEAADLFARGEPIADPLLRRLYRGGTSAGGARPKALFTGRDGRQWIAKFARHDDTQDEIRIEAAYLSLAQQAGLAPARFKVVGTASRPVLLVERFDLEPLGVGSFGSHHMLTLGTVIDSTGSVSYADLAAAVRLRANPSDLPRLYRQMVFNIALGNTDDHPGNFSLLRKAGSFRLSPAYDLVPQPGQAGHALDFLGSPSPPDRSGTLRLAPNFGLSREEATRLLDSVLEVCRLWREACTAAGVPDSDIQRLTPFHDRRQAALQVRSTADTQN